MTKSKFAGSALEAGFKTDSAKEERGVWRQHPDTGIWARIRRSTRPEYRQALRKFGKAYQHFNVIPAKLENEIRHKAAAQELIADWGQTLPNGDPDSEEVAEPKRGPLLDADGEEIRCTFDTALEAFTEMPDFYRWVVEEAETFENFRIERTKADADPLSLTSGSLTSGETLSGSASSNDVPNAANG